MNTDFGRAGLPVSLDARQRVPTISINQNQRRRILRRFQKGRDIPPGCPFAAIRGRLGEPSLPSQ